MCTNDTSETLLSHVTLLGPDYLEDSEREALVRIEPKGFHLRPPPKPHHLTIPFSPESELFQTIHLGIPVIDRDRWKLVIDGMVERPLSVSWSQLLQLPKKTIKSFHECYGPPHKAPTTNLWRIGNVTWTGVPLRTLLDLARPKSEAKYVWSDGLEHGSFISVTADRYQKDLPLHKARSPEVIVAYAMNDEPLGEKRGGPVRLIVPGWFGTNSTKWLCRISLQANRASGPFTTTYYNEIDPTDPQQKRMRPVWMVEPNSCLLTAPSSQTKLQGPVVRIEGRAWGCAEIQSVDIVIARNNSQVKNETIPNSRGSTDQNTISRRAELEPRKEFEWQAFETSLTLEPGTYEVTARATSKDGSTQPLGGRRNHVHCIEIEVI